MCDLNPPRLPPENHWACGATQHFLQQQQPWSSAALHCRRELRKGLHQAGTVRGACTGKMIQLHAAPRHYPIKYDWVPEFMSTSVKSSTGILWKFLIMKTLRKLHWGTTRDAKMTLKPAEHNRALFPGFPACWAILRKEVAQDVTGQGVNPPHCSCVGFGGVPRL